MRALVALAIVALLCAVAAPAAGAPASSTTTLEVRLAPDGDARWNVSVQYPLDSENETAAFRELGDQFERGDTDALSASTFRALAARAAEETGRSMAIVDVNRTATVHDRGGGSVGVLSLTFRWTNFAQVDGQTVRLGDVFVDGLTVEGGQVLRVHPPSGYLIESLPPVEQEVTDGVIRWEGPASFDSGEPSVAYVPSSPQTPTATTTTPTTAPPGPNGVLEGLALVGGVVAGVAVIVASAGAYGLRAHGTAFGWLPRPDRAETTDDQPPPDDGTEADESVDEELLSDEERVERLLRHNDGRMKQANIVSETGWSNAKVSQLLSSMADEDRVEKLQIGRENLISLPDHDEET